MNFKRLENETDEELIYRVCNNKETIGTWEDVRDILNNLLNTEYTESKFRKQYQAFQKMLNANQSKIIDDDNYIKEINEAKRELEREKIKFRDERNAWNRQNYSDTRVEETLEILERELKSICRVEFPNHPTLSIDGNNEMIICLSDLHIGATFDSVFGEYNLEIAKERLSKYLSAVKEYAKTFKCKKAHIVCLGDEINGNIHTTIRITNKEDVNKQIKKATEIIASFCYECTDIFENVYFYSVDGNHSRIFPNKEDSLHDERLDDIISWAVCLSLNHIDNFHDMTHRNLDSGICDMSVCGKTYLGIHGDFDKNTKVGVSTLCTFLGFIPYGIIRGHMHTCSFDTIQGIKAIQSGSLSGCGDDYTIEKRINGKASQMILVCNENGIKVPIPIDL